MNHIINILFLDLLDVLFPRECAGCKSLLVRKEKYICTRCYYNLPKTFFFKDPENPVAKQFWGRVYIEQATSFLYFQKKGMVQEMIHLLKYKNNKEIGKYLGHLFGYELVNSNFKSIDYIIPVPLHKSKLRKRGYNQSECIAQGISEAMTKPIQNEILLRITANTSQTNKHRFERFTNVEKIFEVKNPEKIENKHILLVDDVLTTGATLESCAIEILKISGTRVSIATLATSFE